MEEEEWHDISCVDILSCHSLTLSLSISHSLVSGLFVQGALSAACLTLLNEASLEIENVNTYDIYGDCVTQMCTASYTDGVGEEARGGQRRDKVPEREPYVAKSLDAEGKDSQVRLG